MVGGWWLVVGECSTIGWLAGWLAGLRPIVRAGSHRCSPSGCLAPGWRWSPRRRRDP